MKGKEKIKKERKKKKEKKFLKPSKAKKTFFYIPSTDMFFYLT